MSEGEIRNFRCDWLATHDGKNSEALVHTRIKDSQPSVDSVLCGALSEGLCWNRINNIRNNLVYDSQDWKPGSDRYDYKHAQVRGDIIKEEGLRANKFTGALRDDQEAYIKPRVQAEMDRLEQEAKDKYQAARANCRCILFYGFQKLSTKPVETPEQEK